MRNKSPLLVPALTLTCALVTAPATSALNSNVTVAVDGQTLTFTDVAPQLKDDRTYVPYRAVFEALDATVDFDSATSTVSAQRGDRSVSFVIGSSQVTVTENGQSETMQTDAATYIDPQSNRTMVPVRFAAQALDCLVNWNQNTKTVDIIDTSAIDLLSNYWSNNIQAPMVYRFFADGTVQEYMMEPGDAITPENLDPSRSFGYRFVDGELILEWGDDFETTLNPVTVHSPVTFEMNPAEIPADAVFFYETSWVETEIPDNALYLTKVSSSEIPTVSSTALTEEFSNSIAYSDGKLSFTIPEGPQAWKILISGRLELKDFGGMSVHYLEDTVWENGKSYSVDVSEGGYSELQLDAYCDGNEISIDLLPFLPSTLKVNETVLP